MSIPELCPKCNSSGSRPKAGGYLNEKRGLIGSVSAESIVVSIVVPIFIPILLGFYPIENPSISRLRNTESPHKPGRTS